MHGKLHLGPERDVPTRESSDPDTTFLAVPPTFMLLYGVDTHHGHPGSGGRG